MTARAEQYDKLPSQKEEALKLFMSKAPFPSFMNLSYEEIRLDYARMRLPYRPEIRQPAGMVHGGAIATLIDTVVVAPLISRLDAPPRKLLTIDLHIHYLGAAVEQDLLAEGWIRLRGRSTAFVAAEVFTESGDIVAHGEMAYRIVTS